MKYEDYFNLVLERYPDKNFDKIRLIGGWNKVDFVKKIAELLFIDCEIDTPLAVETRKQLVSLSTDGVHCFE